MSRAIGLHCGRRPDWAETAAGWIAARCVEHGKGESLTITLQGGDRSGESETAAYWPREASQWGHVLRGMAPGTEVRVVPSVEPGLTIILRTPD